MGASARVDSLHGLCGAIATLQVGSVTAVCLRAVLGLGAVLVFCAKLKDASHVVHADVDPRRVDLLVGLGGMHRVRSTNTMGAGGLRLQAVM
jgi:threonine dehydrogenase-like Zn-dependent dehydrogenase